MMPERDAGGGSQSTAPRDSQHGDSQHGDAEHGDAERSDSQHSGAERGALPGPAARPPRPGHRRRKAVLFTLAAVVIAGAAVWALFGSSLFAVRSVTITGAGAVPRAEVLRAAGIKPGTPLARVDTGAVARRVEQITQVQSAQVSRDWPDSVTIVIRERTPVLAIASDGGFALVDRFGVVLGHVTRRPAGMVLLTTAADPNSLRGSPAVGAAVTVLRQLPPPIRRLVRAVAAPSPDAVTLDLRGGITVLWGGTGRAAAKAAELEILMRTKASSYDLSDLNTAVTGG
jgi:cell division protein FtsQ